MVAGAVRVLRRRAGIGSHTRPNDGETNVWLTPRSIIDALGPFDLDPCAADPRPFDCAILNFAEADDGLSKDWSPYGIAWCNPPYGSNPGPLPWLKRLIAHPAGGIALVFARTDTDWARATFPRASAMLFLWGRLHFLYPDGERAKNNAGGPSVLLAFGHHARLRLLNALDRSELAGLYIGPGRHPIMTSDEWRDLENTKPLTEVPFPR